MKLEIRITDFEREYDIVFTDNDVIYEEDFNHLIGQVKRVLDLRENNLSFKELSNE